MASTSEVMGLRKMMSLMKRKFDFRCSQTFVIMIVRKQSSLLKTSYFQWCILNVNKIDVVYFSEIICQCFQFVLQFQFSQKWQVFVKFQQCILVSISFLSGHSVVDFLCLYRVMFKPTLRWTLLSRFVLIHTLTTTTFSWRQSFRRRHQQSIVFKLWCFIGAYQPCLHAVLATGQFYQFVCATPYKLCASHSHMFITMSVSV